MILSLFLLCGFRASYNFCSCPPWVDSCRAKIGDGLRGEFDREFRALASLHHPNIVAFYGMARDKDRGVLYMVQEFCGGGDLWALLTGARELPAKRQGSAAGAKPPRVDRYGPSRLVEVGSQLLAGVAYMHAQGMAHRDLKPQNVLLTAEGRVKICDLGLARMKNTTSTLTSGVGTLAFMPPEAFDYDRPQGAAGSQNAAGSTVSTLSGSADEFASNPESSLPQSSPQSEVGKSYDPRAWDVYSMGVVLWQLWYREHPFDGDSHYVVLRKIIDGKRPQPSLPSSSSSPHAQLFPCPTALQSIVHEAWAQLPRDRPKIAALRKRFVDDVAPLLAGRSDWAGASAAATAAGSARDLEADDGAHDNEDDEDDAVFLSSKTV